MNKLIYDLESEKFIREALGLKDESSDEVFGYVTKDGEVRELKSFIDLLEYVL